MNIIQKHKSKIAKVYLNKEDSVAQIPKLVDSLMDFLSLTPTDYSIQVYFSDVEDITMQFAGLLISFVKTANERNTPVTLFLQSKLADLILNLGTGSLQFSLELITETS